MPIWNFWVRMKIQNKFCMWQDMWGIAPLSVSLKLLLHTNISLQIDVDDVDIKSYIYDKGWASTFISTVVTIMRFDDKYTFKTLFKGQTFFLLSFVLSSLLNNIFGTNKIANNSWELHKCVCACVFVLIIL